MTGKTSKHREKFTLDAPRAHEVILAGDFNDWSTNKHKMKRVDNGHWSRSILLPPGQYEYKFVVDGQWWDDPANPQKVPNAHGTLNSLRVT